MNFRQTLQAEKPLQIVGVLNPFMAMMAEHVGFKALYLSGAGVANMSYGIPDLGMTTLDNVLIDAERISQKVALPLLVDIDTGWEIPHTIREMEKVGVAAIHIEDQQVNKRCGHHPGKMLVSKEEMCDRIKMAVDARVDENFVIMARTDAVAVEGFEAALDRAKAYVAAGADMLFPEALTDARHYRIFNTVGVPVLANITEFGRTPLITRKELLEVDVDMALYPLTLSRVMNHAALSAMKELKNEGTQKDLIPKMMTRNELYEFLDYEKQEKEFNQ